MTPMRVHVAPMTSALLATCSRMCCELLVSAGNGDASLTHLQLEAAPKALHALEGGVSLELGVGLVSMLRPKAAKSTHLRGAPAF